MTRKLTKCVVGIATSIVCACSFAQFGPSMNLTSLSAEIQKQKSEGKTAAQIATAAKAVGASNESLITTAMLSQGIAPSEVIAAVITAFGASDAVVTNVVGVAKLAGVSATVITNAALNAGANTTTVTTATAAGTVTTSSGTADAAATGGVTNGGSVFNGFSSPSSTFSGGGGGRASPS